MQLAGLGDGYGDMLAVLYFRSDPRDWLDESGCTDPLPNPVVGRSHTRARQGLGPNRHACHVARAYVELQVEARRPLLVSRASHGMHHAADQLDTFADVLAALQEIGGVDHRANGHICRAHVRSS